MVEAVRVRVRLERRTFTKSLKTGSGPESPLGIDESHMMGENNIMEENQRSSHRPPRRWSWTRRINFSSHNV